MKRIIITLIAVIICYSCNYASNYTITGSVAKSELEGKKVIFGKWINGKLQNTDTTLIAKGKYFFKGNTENPVYSWIIINPEDNKNKIMVQLIAENAEISVNTDLNGNSKVTGTINNDLLQKFTEEENIPKEKRNKAYYKILEMRNAGTLTPELEQSLSNEYDKYYDEMRMVTLKFVKENINNIAGQSQLNKLIVLPLNQLKEAVANADAEALKKTEVARVVERIKALERTAVGEYFTDIRMPGPDGKEIALSDYAGKGKYVFIDFWASWCAPCRAEMPNLVKAYAKYKDKGFEIVGVSFDYKQDAWLKGIKDLGLTWPQMSDIKGWESEGAKLYAVSGIPHTVLLDKNGTIIAKNLRGEELTKRLEEILGR
jgi:thiol-disulfide isomerase/thioredoxin